MFASTLVFLGSTIALASASLFPTAPVAATTCRGGAVCAVRWQNDATTAPPALTAYGPMSVGLFVGSVNTQVQVLDLGQVNPAQVSQLAARIPATAGPNGDFYFIRFTQVTPTAGSTTPLQAFTAKFTLSGMTGTLSSEAQAAQNGVASGSAAGTSATVVAAAAASSASAGLTTSVRIAAAAATTSSSSPSVIASAASRAVSSASPSSSSSSTSGAERVGGQAGMAVAVFAAVGMLLA